MKRVDSIVEAVCEAGSLVWGSALVLVAVYVSAELLSRKFLHAAVITGANEISGYVLAIAASWAFSYTLLKRSHIRVDIFNKYLSPWWRAVFDVLACLSLVIFAAIFVWYATRYLAFVWQRDSRSTSSMAVPLWMPMLAWYAGWLLFLAVSLYVTAISTVDLYRGALQEVQKRVGSISAEEEAELELHPDSLSAIDPDGKAAD